MPSNDKAKPGPKPRGILSELGTVGLYLLVFAACGWLVLIANLFGFAGRSGWLFPVVNDIAGFSASILLLAVIGLTPFAVRQLFKGKDASS